MCGLKNPNLSKPQSYPKASKQTVRLFDGAFACLKFQARWGIKSRSFSSALLAAFLRDSSALLLDRGKTSMFKNTFALPKHPGLTWIPASNQDVTSNRTTAALSSSFAITAMNEFKKTLVSKRKSPAKSNKCDCVPQRQIQRNVRLMSNPCQHL